VLCPQGLYCRGRHRFACVGGAGGHSSVMIADAAASDLSGPGAGYGCVALLVVGMATQL
jgi:hypothetical protein